MKNFLHELEKKLLVFDGSKGTMLQKMGLEAGACPELWNIQNPQKVKEIYQSYIDAGSDVIQTNTFGANRAILEKFNLQDKLEQINSSGIKLAKEAAGDKVFVAASIGPTGKLLEPNGDLTPEKSYSIFKEQILAVTRAGADLINFETFTDLGEMRTAILAARENSSLPIIASMSFEPNGYTLMGNSPAACALTFLSLGVEVVGVNCSTGPTDMIKIIEQINNICNLPISVKPNAGIPEYIGKELIFSQTPAVFKKSVPDFVKNGARLIGGCCGTTPEHISAIRQEIDSLLPSNVSKQNEKNLPTLICSSSKIVDIDTLDKSRIAKFVSDDNVNNFKNNLDKENLDIITDRIMEIDPNDYDAIYISFDSIGKGVLLSDTVEIIQSYSKIPLILHSNSSSNLEEALRTYNGKAGILFNNMNDLNFDMIVTAKRYGCALLCSEQFTPLQNLEL